MKKIIVFNFLLGLSVCAFAQKKEAELPAFGKVEKAELQMKECPFEENAEAMVLIDEAQLDYVLGSSFDMKKRVRIKILSEKGLDRANVHLSFISARNEEEIRNLEAQTYNLDDNGNIVITKLEKNLIYDKKLNKRETERSFTFPAVKVGSVIEFRYKHVNAGLVDWYFQRSVPVQYSRFKIDMPEEIEVSVTPHTNRPYDKKREESGRRYKDSYSMTNVPSFHDEPFIINEDFYMDRLETKITALVIDGRRKSRTVSWLDVIKFLMEDEDFGAQIKKNIPRTADLDAKLKDISMPYEKMKTIYKYVQDNMQWNDYTGIWAFDGVKSAWKDKKGTSGEINLILVNLLKDAGLKVFPILMSTHANGLVNSFDAGTVDRPGFRQFNKVMALVELDGKPYVLDASQKGIPVHLTPAEVLQTEGLVIEKLETGEWGWRSVRPQAPSKNLILINGLIDADGKMTGQATISSYDYARLSRLPVAKKGKDKFIETYVSGNQGMLVDDVLFENLDSDSLPLVQKILFNKSLNNTGEYSYFSSNILSGLEKNPFVADHRFSDVFFGTNQTYTILGNFTLPEGFEFDALPKNIKMIMPDTSIVMTRAAQVTNGILSTKIQVEFKKPIYAAAEYEDFQEFYKRLFELINEQYVVRKKKA
ncbi:DUF3857 domain-containing protein [Terrimonas sp. NA20]|uniref:DUF3857 domain-containing protein n=1 Tax=Terrimonas ginsenosidimutans TaxID=2908004 RepID=A0ABS9KZT5_9BACT|nr:DUF3857 domain-containing protein [Terrimonas ginsenosidimutans]MCG2617805.1 DUF3857 domain-containing protein [Terrimonas ginsenosidimutans]